MTTVTTGKRDQQNQKDLAGSELQNAQSGEPIHTEEFYKAIIETIHEPLLVLDSDLRVIFANHNFLSTFKESSKKTIGKLVYDLGNRQWDIPELRSLLEEIIPEKNMFNDYQLEHDFPTIGKRIMLINARRITHPQSKQQLILMAIEDVTDRMLSEQALQDSEERFRRAFETAQDGMLLVEKIKGQIINSNTASQKLLGYSLKELQKQKLWEIGFIRDQEQFHAVADQLEDVGFIVFNNTLVKTKTGREVDADVVMTDRADLFQCNIRDITERNQLEQLLQESEEFLNSIVENIPHMIFVKEAKELRYVRFNKAGEELLGFSRQVLYGKNDCDFFPPAEAEHFIKKDKETLAQKQLIDIPEETIHTKDKGKRILHTKKIPILDEKGDPKYLLGISEDITEHKQGLERLREHQEQIFKAFNFALTGMALIGMDGNYLQVNPAFCKIVGYSEKELLMKSYKEITHPDDLKDDLDYISQMLSGEEKYLPREKRYIHKSGHPISVIVSDSVVHDKEGNPLYFLVQIVDTTKHKQDEENIRKLSRIPDESPDLIIRIARDGTLLYINPTTIALLPKWHMQEGRAAPPVLQEAVFQTINTGESRLLDIAYEGKLFSCFVSPIGHAGYANIYGRDITRLKRSENFLKILNQTAISMFTAETLEDLFASVTRQLKKLNLVCMLFPIDKSQKNLITKYISIDSTLLNKAESMVGIKHENFSYPIDALDVYKEVIRKKKTVYQEKTSPVMHQILPSPFKKFAVPIEKLLNIPKFIATPLIVHKQILGAFIVLSDDLSEEDLPAITAFSNQLAAAWYKTELVQKLKTNLKELDRTQIDLKDNVGKLHKSLDGTVKAMMSLVEKRDPYTAGHQERVTRLALAIANELHLPADQIKAINTSGLVHDIGKINVPAEILSKPGKLTPNEFRLLKSHPKDGFTILKNIDFPWPVAEIVHQHHERINGSGYPRHLKGDQICIEAKILAVADVVEAMLSHRPYRAALSKKETILEITRNKGILYDNQVVDACVKLITTGKFKF